MSNTIELLHPITGLAAIGLLDNGRPVWPVLGAEGDEDEGVTEEEGADGEGSDGADEDEGAGEGEAEKPAARKPEDKVSRAELLRATKARDEAKKALRDLRTENARLKQQGEDDSAKATREAAEAASAAAEKKYKPLVIKTTARAELVAAGVADGKVGRLVKLLDLDDIEIDDDGEVSGLTAQVEALKEEYPELFASPEPKTPAARPGSRAADGADKKPASKKPLTASEIQAAALAGG